MPPHGQLFGLLSERERYGLLDWTIANQHTFKQAKTYFHGGEGGNRVDPDTRTALKLRKLGPWEQRLRDRLLKRLPEIIECTGYRGPPLLTLEFELVAYRGRGATRVPV